LGCDDQELSLRRVACAHISQFVYGVTAGSASIALPYINRGLGADALAFAALQTTTASLQVIGGLVFAGVQDWVGTKGAVLLAHGSTLVHVANLSAARSWEGLMFATTPTVAMHGFQASSQIVARNSKLESRSVALGRIAVTDSVGGCVGALLMSRLAKTLHPQQILIGIAGVEATLIYAIATAYPKHDVDGSEADRAAAAELETYATAWKRSRGILQIPGVASRLVLKAGVCMSAGMIFCMIPQYAVDPFGFQAAQASHLMLVVRGMQCLAQSIILPSLTHIKMWQLQLGTALTLGLPLLVLATSPTSATVFVLAAAPISIGWHVINMAIHSSLLCAVPPSMAGTMLGLSMAPMSATFLLSPMLSAIVFKAHGFKCVAGCALSSMLFFQALVAGQAWYSDELKEHEAQSNPESILVS